MQSVVLHGNKAYLPNIAASPSGPLRFNVDTQAFVNAFSLESERDSSTGFANLHLGAREPETGKKKLFFANAWAMGFTSTSGPGIAYTVSAGSDLVVKMRVGANGSLSNTVDADTTRYIDLNDPANPATSGDKAGKNPQGIAVIPGRPRAYVTNFVSRNVSVIDLAGDRVIDTIRTAPLPAPGSPEEVEHRGRRGVLLLAWQVRRAGRHRPADHRAPVLGGMAVVLQLPLQGPDRRRRLAVQRRPAQVGSAERDVRSGRPHAAARAQLLGDLRRGAGLRGQHPQRLGSRRARGGRGVPDACSESACSRSADADDIDAGPGPRAPHR